MVKHLPCMCETLRFSSQCREEEKEEEEKGRKEVGRVKKSHIILQSSKSFCGNRSICKMLSSPLNHENLKLVSSHYVNSSQSVLGVPMRGHWTSPEVVKRNPRLKSSE